VQRRNRLVAAARRGFRFRLPSIRFHRSIGVWAAVATDLDGRPITDEEWRRREYQWLPSAKDRGFVASLMQRVTEPGKMAGWIAPPEIGINNASLDYEYVRLN
jgi:benzoyl-CoA 2,3-dioxygenase component B